MNRTQRARYHRDNKRPAQIMCYAQFSSLISALLTIFIGIFFGLLAKYKPGRYLLEKYPKFFSLGQVSKEGPTKRMAENTNFEMKLYGRGKIKIFNFKTGMPLFENLSSWKIGGEDFYKGSIFLQSERCLRGT